MLILGIETSCDDSAAALVEVKAPAFAKAGFVVNSSLISSQIKIHSKYGGIVPEVAARNHVLNLPLVIDETFASRKLKPQTRPQDRPDLIAVTSGPGLVTSLLVGVWTAQALSLAWQVPLVGVNHIEGHILANWLDLKYRSLKDEAPISLPALCLVVSGGHTELVWVPRLGKYKVLGRTRDDAAGEAYDKVAKLLGLGYPGGPIIDKLSQKGRSRQFDLPRPMINSKDFDFSFSGLKTAARYLIEKRKIRGLKTAKMIADFCASFQAAVTDVLVEKTLKAAQKYEPKTIILGGGVAANSGLRARLRKDCASFGFNFYLLPLKYTTDNAAMIAAAGYVNRAKAKVVQDIKADPNWEL